MTDFRLIIAEKDGCDWLCAFNDVGSTLADWLRTFDDVALGVR